MYLNKLINSTKGDAKCTDKTQKEKGEREADKKKKKKTEEKGGVGGWPVILSPSGTHMKHDGRMSGGIFHCQSEGDMVIHFFLLLLVYIHVPFYCIFSLLSFVQ